MFEEVSNLTEEVAQARVLLERELPRLEKIAEDAVKESKLWRAAWRESIGPTAVRLVEELVIMRQILLQISKASGAVGVTQSLVTGLREYFAGRKSGQSDGE